MAIKFLAAIVAHPEARRLLSTSTSVSSIRRYLQALDAADRGENEVVEAKSVRLKEKIAFLKKQVHWLKEMEVEVLSAPDQQVSLTDPDARSMATSGRGSGIVGYTVQAAVDTEHHLIVAHQVTRVGHDRAQLAPMASKAKTAMSVERLDILADRGYFSGEQILACEKDKVTPFVPRPLTSVNGGKTVRQAGLHLPAIEERLSLSGRPGAEPAVHFGGARDEAARLLDLPAPAVPAVPAEGAVHDGQGTPHQALGT